MCKDTNINISILNKLLSLDKTELKDYFKNDFEIIWQNKINKKLEIINQAKLLHKQNYSITKVGKIMNLNSKIVIKYIYDNYDPSKITKKPKKSILDP